MDKQHLLVRIYDQEIPVTTSGDAEVVKKTAEFVNQQMKMIAKTAQIKDSAKVAIVTCMNIAAELKRLQQQTSADEENLAQRTSAISRSIDQLLELD